jgi:hypothetical protein
MSMKIWMVCPLCIDSWMEERVCMLTIRWAKKIAKHAHTSATKKRGRLRKMYTCHTQSRTGKLIYYPPRDRGCWGPFGERDSSKGEIGTLGDSSQSFCQWNVQPKIGWSVCLQSSTVRFIYHGQHARAHQQQRKGEIEKDVHMSHTINRQTDWLPFKRQRLLRSLWRKGQQQGREIGTLGDSSQSFCPVKCAA